MADPIDFAGSNANFKGPPGTEDVIGLMPVYTDGKEVISCWKMTEIERHRVFETGEVWFSSLSGGVVFPIKLSGLPLMFLIDTDTGLPMDGYRTDGAHVVPGEVKDGV